MKKSLCDMSLEELWELFPIELAPHNSEWKEWAEKEIGKIKKILSDFSPVASHIGSTAIPGIYSKPIIDILVEIPISMNWLRIKEILENSGYICMSQSHERMSFNKGYTHEGYAEKVFHVHIHPTGDNLEVTFRDYLLSHPDMAKKYETLKLGLLPKFRNNRDAYTDAKTEFVRKINELAAKAGQEVHR